MKPHQPLNLFDRTPGRVHIMGICGVGAAGIAWLLHLRGWEVSGCDKDVPLRLGAFFRRHAITVIQGHGSDHSVDYDALVYSAAIHPDEPELVLARKNGIIVMSRGECLAGFVGGVRSVAVCGTHGKTTTGCFTTRLLQLTGQNPLWCLGGYTAHLGSYAGPTHNLPHTHVTAQEALNVLSVVEADESDGTLAYEHPAVTVITNIDQDHLDHFHSVEELETCFADVVANTRESVAVCADHPRAVRIASLCKGTLLTYGVSPEAILRAENLRRSADGTTFSLSYHQNFIAEVTIPSPGDHNVVNALGALGAGVLLGFDIQALAANLGEACGELPNRRFQWLTPHDAPLRVVVDYAHHPVEIRAMMSIARLQPHTRLRVVFQPHRYSRTKMLLKEFPAAFEGADEVILMPLFKASEYFIPGGDTHDLYAEMRQQNPAYSLLLAREPDEVLHYLLRTAQTGDLILIVGAGDIIRLGNELRDSVTHSANNNATYHLLEKYQSDDLTLIPDEPLANHTFFRVGGKADCHAIVKSVPTLSALCILCQSEKLPLRFLGGGSDTWFSDFGLKGVLCSLQGPAFESYERTGESVTVGAGMSGAKLLARLEADGLSGLEFMHGIPGTVGGWARMNAGAHGHALWEHVESVRGVLSDGQLRRLTVHDVTAGYRSVHGLNGISIIAVTFHLSSDRPEAIHTRCTDFSAQRVTLSGLRTCGSLFKNPDADIKVGRVLDTLGVKAWVIGGARVAPQHANVLTAGEGCTASDLLALMYRLRSAFEQDQNIRLQPEVCGFE
ncbi:MAG: Mur ligase family protein [Kiritimatiellia bacterium]